jgi:hypothetical protein
LPHDIEPVVEIETISLYLFSSLLFLGTLLLLFLIWLLFKKFKKRENLREIYLKELQNLNLENPKQSAYRISELGREIVESDRELRVFEDLETLLENFKYRKEVEPFSDEVLQKLQIFLEVVESD